MTLRNDSPEDPVIAEPRFRLYLLCPCDVCGGTGKDVDGKCDVNLTPARCLPCRGEGRVREEVAQCETPQDVGVAMVTLGREGEFSECPFGLLDREGEVGQKWLVSPWLPSPRNVSDAGRVLAKSKGAKHGER